MNGAYESSDNQHPWKSYLEFEKELKKIVGVNQYKLKNEDQQK